MKNMMNRRLFLRGLGGATVAAPFLASVAEKAAIAQGVSTGLPRRMIVFFTHYGCMTNRWFPEKAHGALTKADFDGTTLASLGDYASKILLPRGIRAMNEWSFGEEFGQNNDPHTQVCGSYFTCYPVTPESDKFNATPTGPSLDHICAEQLSPDGTPLFMQIGGVAGAGFGNQAKISYQRVGNQIVEYPGVDGPLAVFNKLTGMFGDGEMSPDTYRVARGETVIDIVRDDLDTLMRVDMSATDKQKLQDWMDLLSQTTTNLPSAQCTAESAMALGLTSQAVNQAGSQLNAEKIDLMLDLAVLSSICNANPVIFMKMPAGFTYRELNQNIEAHSLSHRIGNANMGNNEPCVDGVNDQLAAIDAYQAERFAHLVGRLDSFNEGDGTLLDTTAAVWFNEMSDGNAHNLNNMPIIQAGGCGGYFKVGQAVNLESPGTATMNPGNSDGLCNSPGETIGFGQVDETGTPSNVGNQPINKYFCNLMNAIGVKADASGFPTVGGNQPVTHFGKHDVTADFKDEANPPSHTNTGEFEALRANS